MSRATRRQVGGQRHTGLSVEFMQAVLLGGCDPSVGFGPPETVRLGPKKYSLYEFTIQIIYCVAVTFLGARIMSAGYDGRGPREMVMDRGDVLAC